MARRFFLSYARDDDTHLGREVINEFFQDVSAELAANLGVPAAEAVGFIDRSIPPGDRWAENIIEALSETQLLVCMVSPRFFEREYCGREWALFEGRGEASRRRILPILWHQPKDFAMPSFVSPIQFAFDAPEADRREALEAYKSRGLRAIATQRGVAAKAAQYSIVVDEIAQRRAAMVAEAAATPLPPLKEPSFAAVAPRFPASAAATAQQAAKQRAQVAHFALLAGPTVPGPDAWAWQPYGGNDPVGIVVTQKSAMLRLRPTWLNRGLVPLIRKAEQDLEAAIVLIDPSSSSVPATRVELDAIDSERFDNCAIIIIWTDNAGERELWWPELAAALRRRYGDPPHEYLQREVDSYGKLCEAVETSLSRLEERLAGRRAPTRAVPAGGMSSPPSVNPTAPSGKSGG